MATLPPSREGPIRFGPFEVDPQTGELRKHGIRIRLQDQPCKILLALLEKPGEVVSRDELRTRIWGEETFVDFDHGLSAAVNRLRDALSDSAESPRYVETLARRGYRFIGPVEKAVVEPVEPVAAAVEAPGAGAAAAAGGRARRRAVWVGAAVVSVAAGLGALWLSREGGKARPEPEVVAITGLSGVEITPSFSPDGRQVAFVWNGDSQENRDIYVKQVEGSTESRLTSDEAADEFPAWSPDGALIAFSSHRREPGIYVVSPLGGPARKIAAMRTLSAPAWFGDSKSLVVSRPYRRPKYEPGDGSLFLAPVEGGGTPRLLLKAAEGMWLKNPVLAGDDTLVYAACRNPMAGRYECHVEAVSLSAERQPVGEPRRVTTPLAWIDGLTWNAESGELVLAVSQGLDVGSHLWRVSLEGNAARPELLTSAGMNAYDPVFDSRGTRLAFSRLASQAEIWSWEQGGPARAFLKSSRGEALPQFSGDGRRIAFQSGRGGERTSVWTAKADGTGWEPLTRELGRWSGSPRWSPDDRWIAFDQQNENRSWDIWKIESTGGPPVRLTKGPGSSFIPSWSRDGRWVYFGSDRTGRNEIWRVPAGGGQAEQITRAGGHVAFESVDGKTLYYTKNEQGTGGVYAVAPAGGEERVVVSVEVPGRAFAVVSDGIFHLAAGGLESPGGVDPGAYLYSYARMYPQSWNRGQIRFHEFSSGRSRVLGEILGPIAVGFAVSPDGKRVLYSRRNSEAELFVMEGWR
ncbi:MAG: PD40 domain-containing protein [Acidobacteria bacterium]|nr:PD40 domain-containing protein [Acidobacteriota bacterium]